MLGAMAEIRTSLQEVGALQLFLPRATTAVTC